MLRDTREAEVYDENDLLRTKFSILQRSAIGKKRYNPGERVTPLPHKRLNNAKRYCITII